MHKPRAADNPLISVIIPVFDRQDWIAEAVDSVLLQDHPSFELIVVDDGSTDQTPEILSAYGLTVPRRGPRPANPFYTGRFSGTIRKSRSARPRNTGSAGEHGSIRDIGTKNKPDRYLPPPWNSA